MPADVIPVHSATLRAWIESGEAYVVDVREAAEHAYERIGGALMSLSTFDPDALAVPAQRRLVLHCQSGVRCGMAADLLVSAGFDGTIHRLQGGLLNWKEAGCPVEPGA